MIIDVHGHVSAPTELWAYKANLLSARGAHGRGGVNVSDDEIRAAANRKENWAKGHLDYMRDHGTDVQLISPRPFQLMQSEKPAKLVHWFAEECNNIIYRQMKLFPGKWIGVAALPQTAGDPIQNAIPELERCVKQLGFVGCLLNPDPYENSGTKRRRSAIATGIRSMKSSASWTFRRIFMAPARARSEVLFRTLHQ